ncbi:MAG: ribosome maturation factor RimP [Aeromicrobium erythreum]
MSDRIEELVRRTTDAAGVDLEAVDLSRAGAKRVLRVAVDADGGVGIDTIATLSRQLSAELDASDVMGAQPYTLEVTSRGLDRPLELPRHWRRNRDRLVEVRLTDGSTVRGHVDASDDDGVDLDVDGSPRRLTWDEVATAHVRPELKPRRKDA